MSTACTVRGPSVALLPHRRCPLPSAPQRLCAPGRRRAARSVLGPETALRSHGDRMSLRSYRARIAALQRRWIVHPKHGLSGAARLRFHSRAEVGALTSIARRMGARLCGLRHGEGHSPHCCPACKVHREPNVASAAWRHPGATRRTALHPTTRSGVPRNRSPATGTSVAAPRAPASTRSKTKRKRTCRK